MRGVIRGPPPATMQRPTSRAKPTACPATVVAHGGFSETAWSTGNDDPDADSWWVDAVVDQVSTSVETAHELRARSAAQAWRMEQTDAAGFLLSDWLRCVDVRDDEVVHNALLYNFVHTGDAATADVLRNGGLVSRGPAMPTSEAGLVRELRQLVRTPGGRLARDIDAAVKGTHAGSDRRLEELERVWQRVYYMQGASASMCWEAAQTFVDVVAGNGWPVGTSPAFIHAVNVGLSAIEGPLVDKISEVFGREAQHAVFCKNTGLLPAGAGGDAELPTAPVVDAMLPAFVNGKTGVVASKAAASKAVDNYRSAELLRVTTGLVAVFPAMQGWHDDDGAYAGFVHSTAKCWAKWERLAQHYPAVWSLKSSAAPDGELASERPSSVPDCFQYTDTDGRTVRLYSLYYSNAPHRLPTAASIKAANAAADKLRKGLKKRHAKKLGALRAVADQQARQEARLYESRPLWRMFEASLAIEGESADELAANAVQAAAAANTIRVYERAVAKIMKTPAGKQTAEQVRKRDTFAKAIAQTKSKIRALQPSDGLVRDGLAERGLAGLLATVAEWELMTVTKTREWTKGEKARVAEHVQAITHLLEQADDNADEIRRLADDALAAARTAAIGSSLALGDRPEQELRQNEAELALLAAVPANDRTAAQDARATVLRDKVAATERAVRVAMALECHTAVAGLVAEGDV